MIQQRLGCKPLDPATFRPKGDQRDRHLGRARRLAVCLGITNQHRLPHRAACPLDRSDIRHRVRFAHRQRIGPDQRTEQVTNAQSACQRFRQPLGLVRADCHLEPFGPQRFNRRYRTGVKFGVNINRLGIGRQQHGVLGVDIRFCPFPQPREP